MENNTGKKRKWINREDVVEPVEFVGGSRASTYAKDYYDTDEWQEILACLYAEGWENVELIKIEDRYLKETLEYYARQDAIDLELSKTRKLVRNMHERNKKPYTMYLNQLRNMEGFDDLTLLECMQYNEMLINEINKAPDLDSALCIDFDELVDLYKAGIINDNAMNSFSRLKQIELMMQAEEYMEVNYNDGTIAMYDDMKRSTRDMLQDTSATNAYLTKLIYGDGDNEK